MARREQSQGGAGPTAGDLHELNETQLLRAALDQDMPVLFTCGGIQALNIVMGGCPAQALQEHCPAERDGEFASSYHRIYISLGSKLAATMGSGGLVRVNSRHHLGGEGAPDVAVAAGLGVFPGSFRE